MGTAARPIRLGLQDLDEAEVEEVAETRRVKAVVADSGVPGQAVQAVLLMLRDAAAVPTATESPRRLARLNAG